MIDRELLELAAKAAGKDSRLLPFDLNDWKWNPIADDGDEARLEATLQLHVEWHPGINEVRVGTAEIYCMEPYGTDRQAARRRAGTRAAAKIGKAMS